ncbi:hypothetical protein GFS24_16460 [Chitinophaga sp. SYP-B3965]|uniref:hypothetical protein n=1 Tax=Chitinophaga sp. SYP-B3965 TaxID=2663120 RepID=UPI001299D59F|nr:hypothetical protein [Chitinophaga sp. SYP-B3965]MRG46714.1 hypothetical protein [Chitinophaga sp. SYP-B3965]
MSKRNQHIEEWLRQAAAQDPDVSPDQLKQQAWGQLDQMLDKNAVVSRTPGSSGSGWWMIILEALVLVGSVTYLQVGAGSVKTTGNSIALHTDTVAALQDVEKRSPAQQKEQAVDVDVKTSNSSDSNGSSVNSDSDNNSVSNESSISSGNKFSSSNGDNNSRNIISSDSSANSISSDNKISGSSDSNSNKVNKINKKPTTKATLTITTKPTPESILTITTKQLFVPVKDSGIKNSPQPTSLRTQKEKVDDRSPYSLRIAAILPIADAYGVAANIEYTFRWKKQWSIRPYVGAEYLTGFNRVYDHRYYRATSSNGSPWNQGGPASTDSVLTHFTLNGILYGKAGIQAAYTFSKWEISAGMEYLYSLKVFGKDTSLKIRREPVYNLNRDDLQTVSFNPKQITGRGNLRAQVGLDYMINRRLQIGAVYYMQLNKQKLDSSYRRPHPKMPDRTSFQIHARYFLRKK